MWKYTVVAVSAAAFLAGATSLPAPAAHGATDPVALLAQTNTGSTAPAGWVRVVHTDPTAEPSPTHDASPTDPPREHDRDDRDDGDDGDDRHDRHG